MSEQLTNEKNLYRHSKNYYKGVAKEAQIAVDAQETIESINFTLREAGMAEVKDEDFAKISLRELSVLCARNGIRLSAVVMRHFNPETLNESVSSEEDEFD